MLSVFAKAQDVGNNTLIINSGFTPEIKDTKKILHKPSIPDTVYQAPKFKYSIISSRIETTFEPRPIGAAKTEGDKLDKIYNGYITAGMGNYATPMFEFLYALGRSRDQFGGIQIKHLSSAGKINNYIFPGISDNLARVFYTKLYDKNKLSFNTSFKRSMFHYYGVNTEDTALTFGHDLTDMANSHLFNKATASINFGRYNVKSSKLNYNLDLDYYFLKDNYSTYENGVNFKGFIDRRVDLFTQLKNQNIGLKTSFDFYNDKDSLKVQNAWLLGINPYFKFSHKNMILNLGVNSSIINDTAYQMLFFPDVNLKLIVIDQILNFEFSMGGGAKKNTFNDLSSVNPFINSILPLQISVNRFRASIAMYSSISKYVNFQLGFDFNKWKNGSFFIADTNVALHNKFTVVYDDFDELLLRAGASFHLSDKIDINIGGRYFVYNTNELFAWHKPDFDIKFQGIYLLGEKFRIHADLIYTGTMHAPIYNSGILSAELIKPWFDGSIGVEYRYKKRIGIFANFNNIAASKYYNWYNYPSYGFNFMAGASYIF